jgi:hypothetical protein
VSSSDLDPNVLGRLKEQLRRRESWEERGVIPWLRREFGLKLEDAQACLAAGVRHWGLELEQRAQTPGIEQFDADLADRLARGCASPDDWKEVLPRGLYLERCRKFLAWGAPLAALEKLGAREGNASSGCLTWPDETIFGGLAVNVSTGSLLSSIGLFRINCVPHDDKIYGDLEQGLEPELGHLLSVLGGREPGWRTWRFGRVVLSVESYRPNDFYSNAGYHKYIAIERFPG